MKTKDLIFPFLHEGVEYKINIHAVDDSYEIRTLIGDELASPIIYTFTVTDHKKYKSQYTDSLIKRLVGMAKDDILTGRIHKL